MALGDTVGVALHDLRVREGLREAFLATIGVLTDAVEAKDRFLLGHGEEVAMYVTAVADRLGLEPRRREELVYAALLHDVGKIAISEGILTKPAELTAEERGVIQLHPGSARSSCGRSPRCAGSSRRCCTTTSAGTAAGIPTAWPRMRSPWRPVCSRSRTRSAR